MSIIINYDEWGRMGNRMFQFAFGYILSQQTGKPLFHQGIPNFNIAPNETQNVNLTNAIYTKSFGNNYVDLDLLKNTDKPIVINSFLQKQEYYIPFRSLLQNVFNIFNDVEINSESLVLHIRETDYNQINCFLGYEFYKKMLNNLNYKKVIIVTDNSNCETVQTLLKEGCELNTTGYVDKFTHISDKRAMIDFNTLLKSQNIGLSQSSFSWWAAFLGNHKNIYFPLVNKMWKTAPGKDDIDLYFDLGNSIPFYYD